MFVGVASGVGDTGKEVSGLEASLIEMGDGSGVDVSVGVGGAGVSVGGSGVGVSVGGSGVSVGGSGLGVSVADGGEVEEEVIVSSSGVSSVGVSSVDVSSETDNPLQAGRDNTIVAAISKSKAFFNIIRFQASRFRAYSFTGLATTMTRWVLLV